VNGWTGGSFSATGGGVFSLSCTMRTGGTGHDCSFCGDVGWEGTACDGVIFDGAEWIGGSCDSTGILDDDVTDCDSFPLAPFLSTLGAFLVISTPSKICLFRRTKILCSNALMQSSAERVMLLAVQSSATLFA